MKNRRMVIENNWPFIIGIILLFSVVLVHLCSVSYGFNTLYDEAYFLLAVKDAENGIAKITSLWNNLLVTLFPYLNLYSKSTAYLLNIILSLATASLISIASIKVLKVQNKLITIFFSLLCSVLYLYENQELNYVSLQSFFFACTFFLYIVLRHTKRNFVTFFIGLGVGILSVLEIVTILPSGLLVNFIIGIIYTIEFYKDKKHVLKTWGSVLIGIIIGLSFIHFCVVDFGTLFNQLHDAISSTINSSRGYSPLSMISGVIGFTVKWTLVSLLFLGISHFCDFVTNNKFFLSYITAIVSTLCAFYLINKPVISLAMVLSSSVVVLLLQNKNKHDFFFLFLLLIFPLVASIGTNVYLGNRMACFAYTWVVIAGLLMKVDKIESISVRGFIAASFLIIALCSLRPLLNRYQNSENFTNGSKEMSKIHINKSQKIYFDRVYEILMENGYSKDSSVVFGFNEDFATMYALDVERTIRQYSFKDISIDFSQDAPDFIFLTEYQEKVLSTYLKKSNWNWPAGYEKYFVGSPDPDSSYDTTRNLFCIKE